MTVLTQALRDNPDGFLAELVQKPLDIVFVGDANFANVVRQTSPTGDGTIRGLDRVAWAAITDAGNRHVVTIRVDADSRNDDETEPCYWLPFDHDRTFRIKLKPSKKIADDVAFDGYQYRNRRELGVVDHADAQRLALQALGAGRREPRLFFTAMLTGCSVHIEGEPNAPTVLHGNATRLGTNIATFTKRKQNRQLMRRIERELNDEYGRFAENPNNVAHLSARGYQFRIWENGTLAEKWHFGEDLVGPGRRVTTMRAAVFGVRIGADWRFYAQRIYQYYDLNGNGGGTHRLGTLPVQIWPGGGGSIHI